MMRFLCSVLAIAAFGLVSLNDTNACDGVQLASASEFIPDAPRAQPVALVAKISPERATRVIGRKIMGGASSQGIGFKRAPQTEQIDGVYLTLRPPTKTRLNVPQRRSSVAKAPLQVRKEPISQREMITVVVEFVTR